MPQPPLRRARGRRVAARRVTVVADVMAPSLVDGAPVGAQIEDGEHQGDDDQDVAQRGALAEVELEEGQVVGLRGDVWVAFAGPPPVRPRMMSSTLSV